jgi:NAD(P)-dependent dehydrogenase (short-subunit alcohol dehydrogenase family)
VNSSICFVNNPIDVDPYPALGKYLHSRSSNEERYGRKIEIPIGLGNEFTRKRSPPLGRLRGDDPEKITDEQWRKMMAIDADGVFFGCRAVIPHLEKTKGSIVNTASVSGTGDN